MLGHKPGLQDKSVLQAVVQNEEKQHWRTEADVLWCCVKEFGWYLESDGEPLKDSKRGNGGILSHPGTSAPFPHPFPGNCSMDSVREN